MVDSGPAIDVIRSIAVDPEAVVDAFVYTRENPGTALLRVTPPFHGRMRARLHVFREAPGTDAAYCRPAALLDEKVVAASPSPGEVAEEPDDGDPQDRRAPRARGLDDWRDRAEEAVVERAVLERGDERVRVNVAVLG